MYRYTKTMMLQAAHFCDAAYPLFWAAREMIAKQQYEQAVPNLLKALSLVHGHNFTIRAVFECEHLSAEGWAIDDEALTKLVHEWDDLNLSVHPEFISNRQADGKTMRATTERIAEVLAHKIMKRFREHYPIRRVTVLVEERPEIEASYVLDA